MEMIPTQQYQEAAAYLASRIKGQPQIAIVLGSGLGALADQIEDPIEIRKFDRLGYVFRGDLSSDKEYIFERMALF